ncbi:UNVERIFIED_CONTAM: hypothetical protein K2H54_007164 [Gekko kuhli]
MLICPFTLGETPSTHVFWVASEAFLLCPESTSNRGQSGWMASRQATLDSTACHGWFTPATDPSGRPPCGGGRSVSCDLMAFYVHNLLPAEINRKQVTKK